MTIEEYNEELKSLRDNIALCKQNASTIQNEKNILNSITVFKECEREILRLRKYLNEKGRLNSELSDNFKWAMNHLKINKEYDEVYLNYLSKSKSLMKQYIVQAHDSDYLMLAEKYLGDVILCVNN